MAEINDLDVAMIDAFKIQINACNYLGSPFTSFVLEAMLQDIEEGGPWAEMVADWPGKPLADAVSLRCTGACHALVLTGQAPQLAALYPPTATSDKSKLRDALVSTLIEHKGFVRAFMASAPQTNEVGRSAVLLGGFLEIAKQTGLPLATLEIGASAGLNLSWDSYHYNFDGALWGNGASGVKLKPDWKGGLPPMDAPLSVTSRAGCDIAPIDISKEETRIRLRSYVWPDQTERLQRLGAAIALTLANKVHIEKADALAWLTKKLADPGYGTTRVIYHSIMWQYMPKETRDGIRALIDEKAKQATKDNPLAWLRLEPDHTGKKNPLTLSLWPDYGTKVLAIGHPHGAWVEWGG